MKLRCLVFFMVCSQFFSVQATDSCQKVAEKAQNLLDQGYWSAAAEELSSVVSIENCNSETQDHILLLNHHIEALQARSILESLAANCLPEEAESCKVTLAQREVATIEGLDLPEALKEGFLKDARGYLAHIESPFKAAPESSEKTSQEDSYIAYWLVGGVTALVVVAGVLYYFSSPVEMAAAGIPPLLHAAADLDLEMGVDYAADYADEAAGSAFSAMARISLTEMRQLFADFGSFTEHSYHGPGMFAAQAGIH